jgi:hypothetical protein
MWLVSLVMTVGIFAPAGAQACRCIEPTVKAAYRRADLVVVATIDEVDRSGETVKVRATVSDAWKVSAPAQITFLSGETCAYDVGVGQKHLLFLYNGEGGVYGTVRCRGSRSLASARKSIAWLRRFGKSASVGPAKN